MTLERVLITEVIASYEQARDYDALDRSASNCRFVDDLLTLGDMGSDVLDIGTGTAIIPIELCRRWEECRVMAADLSTAMLELARLHLEIASLTHRVQLDQADAKQLPYADAYFDVVLSNELLRHLPEPQVALREMVRVARPGAVLFLRDLARPADDSAIEQLVATDAADASDDQKQQLAAALRAALRVDEIQTMIKELGFDPATVQLTGDRHWTWSARKAS